MKRLICLALAVIFPNLAVAQIVGLGTTQIGATSQLSIGIA